MIAPTTDTNPPFRDRLGAEHLSPLWDVMANLVTPVPTPRAVAHCWQYDQLRPLLMEAGDLITAEDAERRVLVLENPGLDGQGRVTDSLYGGVQLVRGGEVAPVHRHSQSALRFVLEADRASTSVDGEQVMMAPFDLVLTTNWRWHEHRADGHAIWLDGLDIPIVSHFAAAFAERGGNTPEYEHVPTGSSLASYGSNMRPVDDMETEGTPLFHYPYAQWRQALDRHALSRPANPHTGWTMEFTNPANAGPAMQTISAFAHKFAQPTRPRRQTGGTVFCGVEGTGTLLIDGNPFPVGPRDLISVPSWAKLQIIPDHPELVLFSFSDRVCLEKMGLWREERI